MYTLRFIPQAKKCIKMYYLTLSYTEMYRLFLVSQFKELSFYWPQIIKTKRSENNFYLNITTKLLLSVTETNDSFLKYV